MRFRRRKKSFRFKSREEAELLVAYLKSTGMTDDDVLRVFIPDYHGAQKEARE